jgi:hypothetical protein
MGSRREMCSPKGRDLLVMTRAVRRKWELDVAGDD